MRARPRLVTGAPASWATVERMPSAPTVSDAGR